MAESRSIEDCFCLSLFWVDDEIIYNDRSSDKQKTGQRIEFKK